MTTPLRPSSSKLATGAAMACGLALALCAGSAPAAQVRGTGIGTVLRSTAGTPSTTTTPPTSPPRSANGAAKAASAARK
jgi:hypothetical protein